MITCKTFEEAETIAKEISAKELRGISIVHRMHGLAWNAVIPHKDFIVCDKGGEDSRCHDEYVMYIHNFKTPFEVKYISKKRNTEITEMFATKELVDAKYKELFGYNCFKAISKNY